MNKCYAVIIYKTHILFDMNENAWKCFRCDLIFREQMHAELHKNISNHIPRTIKLGL